MTNPDEPVYPCEAVAKTSENSLVFDGLTKREYFAAMAMQGILSNAAMVDNCGSEPWIAEKAVIQADTLIKELNRKS